MKFLRIFLILAIIISITGCGVKEKESPFKDLRPTGYVNDFANILSDNTELILNNIITRFEKETGIEIAVVTLPEIGDYSIEEAAVEIFERWGIGKKGEDNGLLFVLSLKERKVRIEVGYGLEGLITDSVAGEILDIYGLPFLKKNEFDKGIYSTIMGVIATISQKMGIDFDTGAKPIMLQPSKIKGKGAFASILPFLFFLLIIFFRFGIFWFFPFWFMGSGSGYSGGSGGFSGGFSGFGGGLSGGGGASRGF